MSESSTLHPATAHTPDLACVAVPSSAHSIPKESSPTLSPTHHTVDTFTSHDSADREPTAEFNHAIDYLNKIKARYTDDPDTYRRFLQILQAYQTIQDQDVSPLTPLSSRPSRSQLYAQVLYLFRGAPDLLTEFEDDFLPESLGASPFASRLFYVLGDHM